MTYDLPNVKTSMGSSLSSFAIRHKSPETARAALGLLPTGKRGTFPKFRCSGAKLSTGWYLICRWRHEFTDTELRRISMGGEVVACFIEEHEMVSKATGWKDGREIWSILHENQIDVKHLDVRGTPPPQFDRIRNELFAKQTPDTCDYIFNIPVALAGDLTGFRYDEQLDIPFEVLERPSFLRRIFGK